MCVLTECRQHDLQHVTEVLLEGLQRLHTPRALGVKGRTVNQLPAAAARQRHSTSSDLRNVVSIAAQRRRISVYLRCQTGCQVQ
jgi:hypothetical protein